MTGHVFLLSPARTDGRTAGYLLREGAGSPVAQKLRDDEGCPIGEVFTFLSRLYFRAKLAYARRFAAPANIRVITADRGLVSPDARVTLDDLRAMASVAIDPDEPRYRVPLERDAERLAQGLQPDTAVVLLGSIASPKYVDPLLRLFGDRLWFPRDFVGRGDMSRGGLMLRYMEMGRELAYMPVAGATRKGGRPARLTPVRRTAAKPS